MLDSETMFKAMFVIFVIVSCWVDESLSSEKLKLPRFGSGIGGGGGGGGGYRPSSGQTSSFGTNNIFWNTSNPM